ncbi:ABC transporter ATP-binding protein [Bradyrhizobium canariense]|uniref:NitT/TauT family transport system ATP-binding protein n=1 Tax=Bradyrhizobium canariense TaxID=255045 RepID=A0A1H1SS37_9BRAD|nr:ABC transporter ATP-binding protein [Bradyrhizobium canariense]SDS50678.1 NitT/TauT family transport system ATP-binding protein [Bradyrhizobium canariense]
MTAVPSTEATSAVLEVARLTLDYDIEHGAVRAVENVSFTVGKSERLVLLGPSGCGKSSILKAIAGFIKPTQGHVLIDRRPVKKPGPDRLVVFQEFDQLLPWKTVRENVAFPLKVARGKSSAEARDIADDALAKVGLARALNAYPHTLSGGMKQRAAIARALAAAPEVLLMDEPFAALDALTRVNLQNDLLQLADELKFTLVFVTHSIEEAVLVGTKLHLLSTHPGRTIATFETGAFGRDSLGTPEFRDIVKDINDALFVRAAGIAA